MRDVFLKTSQFYIFAILIKVVLENGFSCEMNPLIWYPTESSTFFLDNILCMSGKRSSAANSCQMSAGIYCWGSRRREDNVYVCADVDGFPRTDGKMINWKRMYCIVNISFWVIWQTDNDQLRRGRMFRALRKI